MQAVILFFFTRNAEQLNDNNYQTYVGLIEPLTANAWQVYKIIVVYVLYVTGIFSY